MSLTEGGRLEQGDERVTFNADSHSRSSLAIVCAAAPLRLKAHQIWVPCHWLTIRRPSLRRCAGSSVMLAAKCQCQRIEPGNAAGAEDGIAQVFAEQQQAANEIGRRLGRGPERRDDRDSAIGGF